MWNPHFIKNTYIRSFDISLKLKQAKFCGGRIVCLCIRGFKWILSTLSGILNFGESVDVHNLVQPPFTLHVYASQDTYVMIDRLGVCINRTYEVSHHVCIPILWLHRKKKLTFHIRALDTMFGILWGPVLPRSWRSFD